MTLKQKFRISLDFTMTVLSIILMGGNYFFPHEALHEIIGCILLVLWGIHIYLNASFYKALFRGKYNAYRVLQAIINIGILLCAFFLMISGIMLSNYVFSFFGIDFGAGFARMAHMLSSHWYFVFMSLHLGLHAGMIFRLVKQNPSAEKTSKPVHIALHALLFIVCAYGLYAFIRRNIASYLFYLQPFFFFDSEKGYILFFVDYISIITLFATCGSLLSKSTKAKKWTQ